MAETSEEWKAHLRRRRELLRTLAKLPVCEVCGVVDAFGAGGGKSQGEVSWTLQFKFSAWRVGAEAIHTRPLTVRKEMSRRSLNSAVDAITPLTVLRIQERVGEDSESGEPHALLE